MLENTEGAIKNGQPRESCNTGYTRWKKKTNTICVGHHYKQTNLGNINKTVTDIKGINYYIYFCNETILSKATYVV